MVLGFATQKIVELGAVATRSGFKQGSKVSVELFAYDFLGLVLKLAIFATVALIIEKVHWVISNPVSSSILVPFFGALGLNLPTKEPDFLARLFSEQGFNGFRYWDIVKFVLIAIVAIEFARYSNANKKLGGEPDTVTMAIFGIILFAFIAFTVPELIAKLRLGFNRQAGV